MYQEFKEFSVENLVGKVITKIDSTHDEIYFYTDENIYHMYHDQNCCENVIIEDICGDLKSLIGEPILKAEERTNNDFDLTKKKDSDEFEELILWTFYEFATIKGAVSIRWCGTSNGYYSVNVSFELVHKDECKSS